MDLNQRITRLRAPIVVGPDGSSAPRWNTPENQWTIDDYWCSFQPVSSKEDLVSQQRVESTHLARLEPNADITAVDRLRYRGRDYTVDGEPLEWMETDGSTRHHWKTFCKRITGG